MKRLLLRWSALFSRGCRSAAQAPALKSLLLRLSALSVVVVLGLIAMAHAQRLSQRGPADSDVYVAASDANPPTDPFSAGERPLASSAPASTVRIVSVADTADSAGPRPLPASDAPPRLLSPIAPGRDDVQRTTLRATSPDNPFNPPDSASVSSNGPASDIRLISAPTPVLLAPAAERSPPDDSGPRPLNLEATTPAPISAPLLPPPRRTDESAPIAVPQSQIRSAEPAESPSPQFPITSTQPQGNGRPGSRQLEGVQSPQLTIEKRAPAEVQVGKPAKFEIRVRNVGNVVASGVEVHDEVPQGATFVSSVPLAAPDSAGHLSWSLGTLRPGEQATIELELAAQAEGEIGSVASVSFRAEASAHTVATKPQLAVELTAPKQAMIGSDVVLAVRVSNTGTGTATGVLLLEHVPEGMRHPAGPNLEFEVGTLKPGASRQIELAITAAHAGHVVNQLKVRGDGNLLAESRSEFDVVAPALTVAMTGPTRRFLERQATYTVSVSNPGTAPAKDVELITQLPRGLKFVRANNSGHYDPQTHTVTWSLEELPPTETGNVTLVALPIEAGQQTVKISGTARQGLSDQQQQTVVVEGLAAVAFDVHGADEAIEVGGETTYQIHVINQGSAAAANLRLAAILPPELKVTHVDGPGRPTFDDHRVEFEPLAQLAPKAEATFRVRAQALQAGDLRVKVQLQTDDMHQPVNKEESTRVYVDR